MSGVSSALNFKQIRPPILMTPYWVGILDSSSARTNICSSNVHVPPGRSSNTGIKDSAFVEDDDDPSALLFKAVEEFDSTCPTSVGVSSQPASGVKLIADPAMSLLPEPLTLLEAFDLLSRNPIV